MIFRQNQRSFWEEMFLETHKPPHRQPLSNLWVNPGGMQRMAWRTGQSLWNNANLTACEHREAGQRCWVASPKPKLEPSQCFLPSNPHTYLHVSTTNHSPSHSQPHFVFRTSLLMRIRGCPEHKGMKNFSLWKKSWAKLWFLFSNI